jgi:hypothetical protein
VLLKRENRDYVGLNTEMPVNISFEIFEEEFSHVTVNTKAEFLFWP